MAFYLLGGILKLFIVFMIAVLIIALVDGYGNWKC